MQKWLDDNGILMHSMHNEVNSAVVVAVPSLLNQLVNEYNNSYDRSIGRKPIDSDYSAWADEIEANFKLPKLKVGSRVSITK